MADDVSICALFMFFVPIYASPNTPIFVTSFIQTNDVGGVKT